MVHKKGIALFSTLLILVLVIMLMSVSLRNTSNIKKSHNLDRTIIQENINITDINKILKDKILNKINSVKNKKDKIILLNALFTYPILIKNEYNSTTIELSIKSNDGKININNIKNKSYTNYIKSIFKKIGIQDVDLLSLIILSNIDDSDKYNEQYRIANFNNDYKIGDIRYLLDFKNIINIYIQFSDDSEARDIEYDKYFKFTTSDKRNGHLDFNYMDIKLIDSIDIVLKKDIRQKIAKKPSFFVSSKELELEYNEEDLYKPDQKLIDLGIDFFTIDTICRINIKSINNTVEYKFNFNIKNGIITNLEMDRWIN